MADNLVAYSVSEAVIHAPVSAIDLTEWVFTLTDSCSPGTLGARPAPAAGAEGEK